MPRFTKILATTAMSGVLAPGLIAAATPASAATCPTTRSPRIDGASAQWTLRCTNGELKVYDWVDDTRADTKCAVVRIDPWVDSIREFKTCGSGTRKTFDESFYSTDSADITLFLR
ncbi:hypothetical protein [Streptomyces sp. NPDC055749]